MIMIKQQQNNKIKSTLERRISEVMSKASETQQLQVLHDLCVMAKASGEITPQERFVMDSIAKAMDIPTSMVCQAIHGVANLD